MAPVNEGVTDESARQQSKVIRVPYSTYYKPMGDLPYITSEQGGGLIILTYTNIPSVL